MILLCSPKSKQIFANYLDNPILQERFRAETQPEQSLNLMPSTATPSMLSEIPVNEVKSAAAPLDIRRSMTRSPGFWKKRDAARSWTCPPEKGRWRRV